VRTSRLRTVTKARLYIMPRNEHSARPIYAGQGAFMRDLDAVNSARVDCVLRRRSGVRGTLVHRPYGCDLACRTVGFLNDMHPNDARSCRMSPTALKSQVQLSGDRLASCGSSRPQPGERSTTTRHSRCGVDVRTRQVAGHSRPPGGPWSIILRGREESGFTAPRRGRSRNALRNPKLRLRTRPHLGRPETLLLDRPGGSKEARAPNGGGFRGRKKLDGKKGVISDPFLSVEHESSV
jgi:hypothetical protein